MASIKIKASFAPPVSPLVNVEDEGALIVSTQDLNFVGAGVTVTENPLGTAEIDIPGNPLTVKDEGLNIVSNPANMNFIGSGVTVTEDPAGTAKVSIPGNPLTVKDEGVSIVSNPANINFIGAGVTVTEDPAGTAKVSIPGSAGIAIGDAVGGAASGDMLFVNSAIQLAKNSLLQFDTANTRMSIGVAIGGVAKLNIKGSGATSATSSFIIKNSANVDALNFKDDLTSNFGGTITGTNFRGTGNGGGSFESNSVSPSTDAFYSLLLGQIRLYTSVGGYFKANTSIIVDANGVGSLNASAISQIDSTTKGFLMPRMTEAQILLIATPANGLMVYNTTQNAPCFYNGTAWQKISHANM